MMNARIRVLSGFRKRDPVAVATCMQLDPTGVELVLIRLRDQYWAEDGKLLGGEWPLVFLLDSSATRVLAQH